MEKIAFSVSVDNLSEIKERVEQIQRQLAWINKKLTELDKYKIKVVLEPES
ncbi:hypothetical protein [Snodgrassella alvi]|uniref:hypothetical protein n=1 Tax=Snodgrassella alvi TaxID=1196083 RepID=UPI0015D55277|nr:hypothetical protein [Snodgrassella alvi]